MISSQFETELHQYFDRMPVEDQREVIDFARNLASTYGSRGISGSQLLRFAGSIDDGDLVLMSAAITEGCEQIEPADWQ